jgi:NAD(P)-dependent dehydrogenase (short-subunit alcohol dehydrogenase family)
VNVLELLSLKGKVALLTGGAGQYGRQIAEALAEGGATVYIASRNLAKLEEAAAAFRAAGLDVRPLRLDLADSASIRTAVETVCAEHRKIDILVNNAVERSALDGWDHELEAYDKSLHVNASALFYLTNLVGKVMKEQRAGSVINIGSMMGLVGIEMANYEGTDMSPDPSPIYFYEKGGMVNFTRWAASILGKFNIRVNCVHPGGLFNPEHQQPSRFVENYSKRTQLGRMAGADDLKGIILLLASDASSYITGANIPVDGGYTAK